MIEKQRLLEKFDQIDDFWTPYIIGELNGQLIKLAKLKGSFTWHSHADEDECFQVIKGRLVMELRDQMITLEAGDLLIVPKGVEHNPHTLNDEECLVMLFEPKTTLHTGDIMTEQTNNDQKWL